MPASPLHPDDVHKPPTVRSTLESGHHVLARCDACARAAPLDLPALVAAGRGEVALLHLPLRCACGSRGYSVTVTAGRAYYDPGGAGR